MTVHFVKPFPVSMASCTGLAHCKVALAFAVIFDLVGVMVLLAGVFVPLEVKGRDFGDLLVYTGVILVLISLGGWVMWYSGNIEAAKCAFTAATRVPEADRQKFYASCLGHHLPVPR
ncbi:hypothetical protein HF521_015670 [Silurus meridionalis]|uniref:Transmembrane protein 238 n=1 Tax=Silurus meridionalis TaxID=175797 RepID=A0A8T0A4A2_SILME|nr:hypothetical protein HF521_015670 [Silurus meridionalis]